jgi:hypothetical protein
MMRVSRFRTVALMVAAGAASLLSAAEGHDHDTSGGGMKDCPMAASTHSGKNSREAGVVARGDAGMGFDHALTTHHFLLSSAGGSIEVTANDPSDTTSRDQIRMHLAHIQKMFSAGDFSIPMFVHDTLPPGVTTMKRLASAIEYRYEDGDRGGKVVISTTDPAARDAIQDFLRFQIADHDTGDPLTMTEKKN